MKHNVIHSLSAFVLLLSPVSLVHAADKAENEKHALEACAYQMALYAFGASPDVLENVIKKNCKQQITSYSEAYDPEFAEALSKRGMCAGKPCLSLEDDLPPANEGYAKIIVDLIVKEYTRTLSNFRR